MGVFTSIRSVSSCLFFLAMTVNGQETLDAMQFKSLLEAGAFAAVLDVRTIGEFYQGHIGGATLMNSLASGGSSPSSLRGCEFCDIAVYCNSGARAAAAITVLRNAGFQGTLYNALGVTQWTAAGYPLVRTQSKIPVCTMQPNVCDPGFVVTQQAAPFEQQQGASDGRFTGNIWNERINNGGFDVSGGASGGTPPASGSGTPPATDGGFPPATGSGTPPATGGGSPSGGTPATGGGGRPAWQTNPWGPRWDDTTDTTEPDTGGTIDGVPNDTNAVEQRPGSDANPFVPPPQSGTGSSGAGGFPATGSGSGPGGFPATGSGGTWTVRPGASSSTSNPSGFPATGSGTGSGPGGFPAATGSGTGSGSGSGPGGFPAATGSGSGPGGFPATGSGGTWTVRPGASSSTSNPNSVEDPVVDPEPTNPASAQTPPATGQTPTASSQPVITTPTGTWTWKEEAQSAASISSLTFGALFMVLIML